MDLEYLRYARYKERKFLEDKLNKFRADYEDNFESYRNNDGNINFMEFMYVYKELYNIIHYLQNRAIDIKIKNRGA